MINVRKRRRMNIVRKRRKMSNGRKGRRMRMRIEQ